MRAWLVPLIVIIVAAVLIAAALSGRDSPRSDATSVDSTAAPTVIQGPSTPDYSIAERRDPLDPLTAGSVDAPVVIVAFSDYQCPFCARWTEQTLPTMLDFVDEGQVRIEWRDLSVFGADSERAAHAAYAAALQGAFWEYHDALFPGGVITPAAQLSRDSLVSLASDLGLDVEQFAADMDSASTAEAVASNQQEGIDLGIFSTPVFIVDGQPIVGAQPTSVFVDAVNRALVTE